MVPNLANNVKDIHNAISDGSNITLEFSYGSQIISRIILGKDESARLWRILASKFDLNYEEMIRLKGEVEALRIENNKLRSGLI